MDFSWYANKNIVVTGAAGFIGSNLCERLLELGARVVAVDSLLTGFESNIEPLKSNPNFTFLKYDITQQELCIEATQNCDVVFHQAALGSVPRSIDNPINTNNHNINGFLNMLNACRLNKVSRFVYASSSSVYGDEEQLPKLESKIGNALSPYAVTKQVNEQYAQVFYNLYGTQTIGLRYFNVFGRKQSPDGVYAAFIPKFIDKLIKHESPVINGDGTQSRDFTYIENVLQANLLAGSTQNNKAFGEAFNVAFGERFTINEISLKLKELLGNYDAEIQSVEILYGPPRVGDIPHSLASIDKAKNLLGYQPKYNVLQGLHESIEWYWNALKKEEI